MKALAEIFQAILFVAAASITTPQPNPQPTLPTHGAYDDDDDYTDDCDLDNGCAWELVQAPVHRHHRV
jgi:hypothetical protein